MFMMYGSQPTMIFEQPTCFPQPTNHSHNISGRYLPPSSFAVDLFGRVSQRQGFIKVPVRSSRLPALGPTFTSLFFCENEIVRTEGLLYLFHFPGYFPVVVPKYFQSALRGLAFLTPLDAGGPSQTSILDSS